MPFRQGVGLCRFVVSFIVLSLATAVAGQPAQAPSSQDQMQQVQKPPVQELQWKTYSYPADGFSAMFPFEPSQDKKDIESASGTYQLHSYITEDDQVALYVGVCDYGEKTGSRNPDTLLGSAKDGALKNSNSRLIGEQAITLGIYHGLEFQAENDSTEFTARLYMVGSTLYQTLVVTPKGHPYANTTRFLNSFQLIARPAQ